MPSSAAALEPRSWVLRRPGLAGRATAAHALCGCLLLAGAAFSSPRPAGDSPPQRLIALAPSVTEILFALGLGDRVVAVGEYSRWPPEAAAKPRIGGLVDPNLEEIVALRPDLAVLLPSEKDVGEQLQRLGVEVLTVRNETLAEVEDSIATIARRTGVPEAGRELAAQWRTELAPRPLPQRPRVALVLGREPGRLAEILVAGPGTFLDELLGRLGAVNVFADAALRYPQVGLEEVIARAPEVIVELQPEAAATASELRADWQRLQRVQALRQARVEVLTGAHVLLPGPRLPRLLRELAAALAPPP